jgi:hypothetical protein
MHELADRPPATVTDIKVVQDLLGDASSAFSHDTHTSVPKVPSITKRGRTSLALASQVTRNNVTARHLRDKAQARRLLLVRSQAIGTLHLLVKSRRESELGSDAQ